MSILTAALVIALVFGCFAEEEEPRWAFQVPRYLRTRREPHQYPGFVHQCYDTGPLIGESGHVNVVAFLDPSWYYSFRQAIMLDLLKKRLERSGFTDIVFFIVIPSSNLPENTMENNVEIKTWKRISMNMVEPEYILGTDETQFNDLARNSKKDILCVQDTPDLGIWERFRASKDEVVVVDRCGRLTYQVIIPWSILYFPYVKAAILSTYKENPCGPCDVMTFLCNEQKQPVPEYSSMVYNEYLPGNINVDIKGTEKTFDSYTEGTPHNFESESVTVLSEKSKENDKYTTTVAPIDVNLSTNETTTSDVTITDTPLITADHIYDTTPVEDIRQDNNMTDNATFTDDKIETTTEISLEHGQTVTLSTISEVSYKATEEYNETQDIDPFKAQMNTSNTNTLLTIVDTDTDLKENHKKHEDVEDEIHETKTTGIGSAGTKVTKNEKLPLRIILYAPHIHKENETLKQYTHLILQAGNPGYHDHFNYMSAVDEQKPMISENSDPTTVGNKMSEGFISGINESPGVYGEIADYWRTEDDEFNNQNENIAYFEPDDVTIDDVESKIDNNESHTLAQSVDVNADADIKINVSSEDSDEFVQRRLIEHYRKLLSWIYYSL
ncbi:PREDICTED: uncharacterized protein LOC107188200 [Dufourea novaeangliae]|uniref:uncharacterized protein LOC107188200 n=1 Tax=Dufourea novaeangliae TaxID=178035 RepID=UPI0007673E80|nr:PREDICTED: uncharacterized protein LOC107188200 [Dufourea novaeangliae]